MPRRCARLPNVTIGHYDRMAHDYWAGTQHHDVSQNRAASDRCNRGRAAIFDPRFRLWTGARSDGVSRGRHDAVGLDGAVEFVAMARRMVGCEVLHQEFLRWTCPRRDLTESSPTPRCSTCRTRNCPGAARIARRPQAARVLFSSNPRGRTQEGWAGGVSGVSSISRHGRGPVERGRLRGARSLLPAAGKPRHEQFWLASVWRKT